jgi:3-dehydroquinate dehydratase-2
MSYKENIKMKILVMNGPNINFLGIREKGIYGTDNYETLVNMIENKAKELGVEVEVFQSNHEGAVIDKIQEAYYTDVDGIVINPGAFTHYSYAVRDALASVASIPKIEVHISNVHTSVTVPVCNGQVVGLGLKGYLYAMEAVVDMAECKAKE